MGYKRRISSGRRTCQYIKWLIGGAINGGLSGSLVLKVLNLYDSNALWGVFCFPVPIKKVVKNCLKKMYPKKNLHFKIFCVFHVSFVPFAD